MQRWGTFEPETGSVYIHQEAQPEDDELLDYAAAQTLLNKGVVFPMGVNEVPGRPPIAATFRW